MYLPQRLLLLFFILALLLVDPRPGAAQVGMPYDFVGEIVNPNDTIPAGYYGNLTGDGSYGWQTGTSDKDLVTNGFTFTLDSGDGNKLDYSGVIYGSGHVNIKAGKIGETLHATMPVILSGNRPQQYTGVTTLLQGVVVLNKTAGVTAIPGNLAMKYHGPYDELRWGAADQIADHAILTIDSHSGKLNLNGFSETIDTVRLTTGAIITGSGQLMVRQFWYGGVAQPSGVYTAGNATFVHGAARLVVALSPYDFAGAIINPNATIPAGYYGNLTGDGSYGWQTGTSDKDLVTNGFTFTLDSGDGNALDYSGVIYGSGQVNVKAGRKGDTAAATMPVVLSGNRPQQYTGVTTLLQGVVVLNKAAGVTAIPGNLTMKEHGPYDELRWGAADQIADHAILTINSSNGKLNLNGFSETVDTLRLTTGAIITGSGQLTVRQFWYGGVSQPGGVYTLATAPAFIAGAGRLVVNAPTAIPTTTPTATPTVTPTTTPTATPIATPTATPTTTATPDSRPLVLVYAVLDNNLGQEKGGENWNRLLNNLEKGVHAGVNVRLMIDGYGAGNSAIYDLVHDDNPFCPSTSDPTCGARYVDGVRRTAWSEDTAHPQRLYEFVKQEMLHYPTATKIILVLVGHGSGWSANGLPGQPTRWGEQFSENVGGMLWDDTPGDGAGSRSLSTKALGVALTQATKDAGRPFDLLYLDACSMGMVEVAYEVRDSAHYLLASPNTDWATFAYQELLPQIAEGKDGRDLGEGWLQSEAKLLRAERYPATLALFDLAQLTPFATTVSTLAEALMGAWATQPALLTAATQASERYESNYDGTLSLADSYVDLASFTQQLQARFVADSPISNAAGAVQQAINQVVVAKAIMNGNPWPYPGQTWHWEQAGGLAIYLPTQVEKEKRLLYTPGNLAWARDGVWDEFLQNYWAEEEVAQSDRGTLPTCVTTAACSTTLGNPLPIFNRLFLPLIRR